LVQEWSCQIYDLLRWSMWNGVGDAKVRSRVVNRLAQRVQCILFDLLRVLSRLIQTDLTMGPKKSWKNRRFLTHHREKKCELAVPTGDRRLGVSNKETIQSLRQSASNKTAKGRGAGLECPKWDAKSLGT